MFEQTNRKWHIQFVRLLWPVLLVLAANLVISAFIGRFTFIGGAEALWKVPFRYFRFSLILVIPIFLIPILIAFWGRLFTFGQREFTISYIKYSHFTEGWEEENIFNEVLKYADC